MSRIRIILEDEIQPSKSLSKDNIQRFRGHHKIITYEDDPVKKCIFSILLDPATDTVL